MGHCVRAIIGAHKDIQRIENNGFAKGIKLPQRYGMIFLTDALLDNIGELFESANEPSDPETVTSYLLQEYSFHTKLAYIEADYSSGIGTHSGILYENGKISIPLDEWTSGSNNFDFKKQYSVCFFCICVQNMFPSLNNLPGIMRRQIRND